LWGVASSLEEEDEQITQRLKDIFYRAPAIFEY
jgi:hypothetical protein